MGAVRTAAICVFFFFAVSILLAYAAKVCYLSWPASEGLFAVANLIALFVCAIHQAPDTKKGS